MFKKLLKDLLGNDEEKKEPQPSANAANNATAHNQHEAEEEEEEEYEDNGYGDDDGNAYDPQTHHGLHYTQAQFDAEVDRRVNEWKADEEDPDDADIRNAKINFGNSLYREWNRNVSESQYMKFNLQYGSTALGYAVFGSTKHDAANPLLEPIHGITLQDYAAASSKMASGIGADQIAKALGVEQPVWEEASTLWISRMQQDNTFTVTNLFGTYFGESAQHPKLGGLAAAQSESGKANLEKLATDRYFYEELCGARQAAYEYGLDGAQWIMENYGIALGDFQNVAMKYMTERNAEWNSNEIMHFQNYQEEKQKEYAAKFAAEQGGNVADDVEF